MTHRMLVVEDEENVRESIAVLLELEGYEVCTAKNGAEALRMLAEEGAQTPGEAPFALIILDLMMPQVDGWSFRARQLQKPEIRDIPVVVLSGVHDVEREVRELKPAAIIQKPVSVSNLLGTIGPFINILPTG